MFVRLKQKLQEAIKKFTRSAEESLAEEPGEEAGGSREGREAGAEEGREERRSEGRGRASREEEAGEAARKEGKARKEGGGGRPRRARKEEGSAAARGRARKKEEEAVVVASRPASEPRATPPEEAGAGVARRSGATHGQALQGEDGSESSGEEGSAGRAKGRKGGLLSRLLGRREEKAPGAKGEWSGGVEAPVGTSEEGAGEGGGEPPGESGGVGGAAEPPSAKAGEEKAEEEVGSAGGGESWGEQGFLSSIKERLTTTVMSEEKFEELFWDLEVALLENNVAIEVVERIKEGMRGELTRRRVTRRRLEEVVMETLRKNVEEILSIQPYDLVKRGRESGERPFIIVVIGVNGSGKTTTMAKLAHKLQEEGLSVVFAAADTFRAAAIEQLRSHAERLGVKLVSQGYGADPAAVAYDAVEHARAQGVDVVMIDTAGRLHANKNLMAELEKVVRVSKPHLKLFIGESITGNDCVEQAKEFDRLVGIDAIILSKADVDEKGGAALSISWVTKKPILYLGTGQSYDDLEPFRKEAVIASLGL